MTDKELIQVLRKVHDATFTPGVYEHSIYGVAADRLEAYPRYKALWLKAFADLQAERIKCGKEPLKSPDGRVYDAEGLYGWWMQSKEVYGQCDLFAEMEGE